MSSPEGALDRFVKAVCATFRTGDPEPLCSRLAPAAVAWHNTDNAEMSAHESLNGLAGLNDMVDDLHVDVTEQGELAGGGFLRFVIVGTMRATRWVVAAHNCVFVRFDSDGLVTRMDEYIDPKFSAQLAVESAADLP